MDAEKLKASVVSMLADQGAKNAAAKLGMDLDAVTKVFNAELNRIEGQLSVMLSHVEGRYESESVNLKLEVTRLKKKLAPSLASRLLGAFSQGQEGQNEGGRGGDAIVIGSEGLAIGGRGGNSR